MGVTGDVDQLDDPISDLERQIPFVECDVGQANDDLPQVWLLGLRRCQRPI